MSETRRVVRSGSGRPREVLASAALEPISAAGSLIELVEDLADAMVARDGASIHALLGDPRSARLPRDVREEAMVFSALPERSSRAPMRTLVHLHRMRELERGGEIVSPEQTELFSSSAARERRHARLSREE